MKTYIPGIRYCFTVTKKGSTSSGKLNRSVRILQVDSIGMPICWWIEQESSFPNTVRGTYLDTSYFPGGFLNWLHEWQVDPDQVQFDTTDPPTAAWMISSR